MLNRLQRRIRAKQARQSTARAPERKVRFEAMESRFLLSAEVVIPPPDPNLDSIYDQELEQTQLIQELIIEEQQIQILELDPIVSGADAANQESTSAESDSAVVEKSTVDEAADETEATFAANNNDQTTETSETPQDAPVIVAPLLVHQPREIVFVDSGVEDYQDLLDGLLDASRQQTQAAGDATTSDVTGILVDGVASDEQPADSDGGELLSLTDDSAVVLLPNGNIILNASFIDDDTLVVLLDADRDGIDQISEVLQAYEGIAAVHILSHGSNANVRLGNTSLNNAKLKQYSEQLKGWGRSLTTDGDILLYGCSVANGTTGVQFVQDLGELTGADVAASDDDTGSAELGGDWQLELSTGVIEASPLVSSLSGYGYLLAVAEATTGDDTITLTETSLNDATPAPAFPLTEDLSINALAGDDTVDINGFPDTSSFAVDIDGGDGTDVLNFSSITGALTYTFNVGSITVSDVDGNELTVKNIETINGGAGDNTFVFNDGATFAGTINGGAGNNTFNFGQGVIFAGTINGGTGGNALDFLSNSDLLTFSGSSIISSITSTNLNITHSGIDNIDVNMSKVNITSTQQQALLTGLSELTTWGANLQTLDEIGAVLAGLGANVGVNLGNSLDVAESLDQLRLEIKQLVDAGNPVHAQNIQDRLNEFNQQDITYADRSIIGDVFVDPTVGGTFDFDVELTLGDSTISSPISVNGATSLDDFVTKANDAITENSDLSGKMRAILVTNANGVGPSDDKTRIAFQITSSDVTEFSLEQTAGSNIGFSVAQTITGLKDEIQDLSELNIYSTGGLNATLDINNGLPELVFSIDLNADRTNDFKIDLGKNAEDLGLAFDAAATVPMETTLSTDLDLILKLNDTNDPNNSDFLFNLNNLTLNGNVNSFNIDTSANIGFLAATATGTFNLNAEVSTVPDSNDADSLKRLDPGNTTLQGEVEVKVNDFDLTSLTFTIDDGNIDGLETFNEAGNELTINLENGNPFEGRDISLDTANFDKLGKFSEFNAATFVGQIGTIRDWFGSVSDSEIFNQIDIPFITPALDAIFDMADTVGDNLLYDDGGDGKDDDATLVVDLREALKDAGLDSKLRVEGDENKIKLIAIDSSITDIDIDAVDNLGFTGNEDFDTDSRTLTATNNATADAGNLTFNIKINNEDNGTAVTLSSDATANNTAIGNDTAKLVDENNEATFKTTQELADKLSGLLTVDSNGVVIKPKYDVDSKILTFDLIFTPVEYQLNVPVDFNFDLSPIGNIGTAGSPDISLGAGIDISLTLGLDLNDTPAGGGKDLETTTKLVDLDGIDSLDDAIRPEYSVSADQVPSSTLGNADTVDIEFVDAGAVMTGSPKLTFADNASTSAADTIVRSGGSWVTDGFKAGQKISITGANDNNGTYTIAENGVTDTEITLVASNELKEEDKSGVKVTGAAATMTESPELNFSTISTQGLITRSEGNFKEDGFRDGDYIVVEGAGVNDGVYQIETVFEGRLTLVAGTSFADKPDVKNVTITVPDRIVLNSGGNWGNDEFKAGQILSVSGTQLNNRTSLISGVSNDGLTLFLSPDARATAEHLNNDQDTKDAPGLKLTGGPVIRLSENAVFSIDGVAVTVLAQPVGENSFVSATSDNKNLFDLANDINSALQSAFDDAGSVNKYKAEISNGKIIITDISENSSAFTLTTDIDNTAHTELGFGINQTADSDDLLITLSDGSQHRISLDGDETIQNVIDSIWDQTDNKVIAEIDPDTRAGLRLIQVPAMTGNPRLTFDATGNAIVREDGRTWTEDHFADGQSIRISGADESNNGYYTVFSIQNDPDGKSFLVLDGSIADQTSVKDVRITLASSTIGEDEIFRVEALNGSRAAGKLGILQADIATDVDNNGTVDFNDSDGIINGDAIAGASILDRIFIQDPTVTGNVFIETPDGIEVVGDFGFVSVALNGDGSFNTNLVLGLDDPTPTVDGITINELIKSLSHISSIVSIPTIGGDKVNGALEFNNKTITIGSSNDATWDGFVASGVNTDRYISVIGTSDNNGHYKITGISGKELTVERDQDFEATGNDQATVLNQIGSFSLGVDVLPDFGLINEEATETHVVLFDFGNPFADTEFKQEQFTLDDSEKVFVLEGDWSDRIKPGADVVAELEATVFPSGVIYVSENSFSLAEDQRAKFELGAKVTVTLGTTQVTSKIKSLNYDDDLELSTFILEDNVLTDPISSVSIVSNVVTSKVVSVSHDAETKKTTVKVVDAVLTSGVTNLTVDTPRSLDYMFQLPDLGNLIKFDSIGISQIIDGLIELSDFLGQFEAFGFLDEPIPLINVSVNDVLAFADRFDAAVTEAQNNPAGTLQVLENKLKEALGIPSGIDSDALGFTERMSSDTGVLTGDILTDDDVVALTHDSVFLLSLDNGPSQLIKVVTADASTIDELVVNINTALSAAFATNVQARRTGDSVEFFTDGDKAGKPLAISNPIDFSIYEDGDLQLFRMDFGLGIGFTEALDVEFDLGDSGILSGSADLQASGAVDFALSLGIDLDNPADIYLFDSSISGQLEAIGDDIAFRAGIGPVGVFINGGEVRVGGDIGEDDQGNDGNKLFNLGIDFDDDIATRNGYELIPTENIVGWIKDNFKADLAGSITANLPVYFPAETLHKGSVIFEASLAVDKNGNLDTRTTLGAVNPEGVDIAIGDLFTFDLNELSLMDNLLLAVDGVDAFLEGLQDILDGEVFGVPLPLVGDKLSDGARFIEDLREDFVDPFRDEIVNMADQDENIVSEILFDLLGPGGIGLLLDANGDGVITIIDVTLDTNVDVADGNLDNDYMQWNMLLGQTLNLGTGIGFDLGIPGLGLETQGDINVELGWNLDFGFGISFEEAFYLDISDDSELEASLEVTLPDFGLSGELAILQLDATGNKDEFGEDLTHFTALFGVDVYNKNDENDERLAFSEFGSIGLDAGIAGEAVVDLHFELKLDSDLVPGISGVFPKIVTDFILDWSIGAVDGPEGAQLVSFSDLSTNLVIDGLKIVEFQDVSLDLGSFISDFIDPILGTVREVTEPLQPIIDFITTPLPVISDIGPELTVLDLAEMTGKVNTGLIESIADLITFVNAIPLNAETVLLNFGNFTIYKHDDPELNLDITDPNADVKNEVAVPKDREGVEEIPADADPARAEQTKTFKNKLQDAGDFAFPIISDPTQIFNLLLGKDAVLMTYDLKPLVAEFSYKQSFPVYGPLFVAIKGELGVTADFAFGFDTLGITQFADSGFRNPALIFNGFYISDTDIPTGEFGTDVPELTVSGFLGVAAELNLGIASAGAGGGVGLNVYFDLFDPNHDGRVRVPEIFNSIINEFRYGNPVFAPMALFDVSGEIYAQLFAYIEFLFFQFEFDITPPITILEFDIPFTRVPTLAEDIGGGVLQLNMGDFASQRLNNNIIDGDETFNVYILDEDSVKVTANFGGPTFEQTYHGVDNVFLSAGEGNDTINVYNFTGINNTTIGFELEGGVGNDRITLGANVSGSAVIKGGVGDDVITSGGGDDEIYGGAGLDVINGGNGNDVIFGDEGEIVFQEDEDGEVLTDVAGNPLVEYTRARVKVTDANDVINGGAGDDKIFGGGGEDEIYGGADNDLIIGDGGILRDILQITARNDVADYELTDDAVLEFIIDGEDFLINVLATDTVGNTTIEQLVQNINDQLADEGIADRIEAGYTGDSIRFTAAAGVLEVRVKGGNDIATAELGFTSFFKKVTVLDDINRGDGKADTLHGNDGDDVIYGGRGDDTIYGDADDDRLYGDDGFDLVYGNTGNDRLYGGTQNDRLSGGADDDHIEGGAGHDRIWGDWMVDEPVVGTAGVDSVWGGTGIDTIFGGAAGDFLFGDSEPDYIFGEEGDDTIDGGHGADQVFGGDDNDTIISSQGDDFIDGQRGSDDFIIDTMGGDMSSLLTIFDSGAAIGEGTDTLIVNGTEAVDRILLRAASADVFDATLEDLNMTLAELEASLAEFGVVKNLQMDLSTLPPRAFVSKLNSEGNVERINYYDNLESIIVNGLGDNDHVVSDNTNAAVTINGGDGDDLFQVGQIFNSPRDTDAGIDQYDVFDTVQTTKGFLSNGINAPMTINGEDGNDSFVVFRNLHVLTLNGGDGDDEFLVKAFALEGSVDDPDRDLTDITGAGGADLIQYSVNAPVAINGGDGLDTVIVLGTEFGDDFVVTAQGVYGAGLNVNFAAIEILKLDTAEGNDRIFVLGTGADHITEIFAGEGSDAFFIAGDTPPIVSQDLLGHSGIISHESLSDDGRYNNVSVDGISANIGDDDEPFIRIIKDDGMLRITEDGLMVATYSMVLTRAPKGQVGITAIPPRPSPDEEKNGIEYLEITETLGGTDQMVFDASNWFIPQTFEVIATQDLAYEGKHIATINHLVTEFPVPGEPNYEKMAIPSVNIEILDDNLPGLIITQSDGSTHVIEGADFGDAAPFADEYTIKLNQQPDSDVTISLVNEDGQLEFEQTSLTFTSANWDTAQTVRLIANDDSTNEGFHHGYIKHEVSSSQGDVTKTVADEEFAETIEALARSSVLLDYAPIDKDAITSVVVGGESLDADRYTIDDKRLTILDKNGEAIKVTDKIVVTYDYIDPGFQNVAIETIGVGIGDNDAPGVLVQQSGGSTNVLESGILTAGIATGADATSIEGDFSAGNYTGLSIVITSGTGAGQARIITSNTDDTAQVDTDWDTLPDDTSQYMIVSSIAPVTDSYQIVLTARPDFDVVISVTPQPTKTSARPPFQFSADDTNVAVTELEFTTLSDATISLTSGKAAPEDGQLGGDLVFYIDLTPDDDSDAPVLVTLAESDMAGNNSIDDLIDDINLALQNAGLLDIEEYGEIENGINHIDQKSKIAATRDEQRIVLFKVTEPQHEQVLTSTNTLTFTEDSWNIPQTVFVSAINDDVVDGGDIKAFAPIEQTLARIQGPLIINGAGGEGSDAGLGADPFRMPGETNDVGNVVEVPTDTEGEPLSNQVVLNGNDIDKLGPTYFKSLDTFEPGDENDDSKAKVIIKISSGPGEGQERIIVARNDNTFILAEDWDSDDLPTEESRYFFIRTLAKVNEAEQVDVATVFHHESVADNTGTLTATRLFGLGMGPDIEMDGLSWPGGLTYTDLENITIHMGRGDDQLDIYGSHNRDDFRTVTIVNTGAGDDRVNVDIEAENDFVTGGDVTSSRTSHLQDSAANFPTDGRGLSGYVVQVTDADGNVQERTILFNDVDSLYVDEAWENLPQDGDSYEIFRHPAGLISINTQAGDDRIDASASTAPLIAFGGLGADTLIGGAGDDILIGDRGQIDYIDNNGNIITRLGSNEIPAPTEHNPEDPDKPIVIFRQTDGVFRDPAFVKSIEPRNGGNDRLHGSGGDDLLIGGAMADSLYGDAGNDVLIGDGGQKVPVDANSEYYETIDNFIGGNDILDGGAGFDVMFGAFGSDEFGGNFDQDMIFGEYGRVRFADGKVESILRLGQGPLDLAASTLYSLYGVEPYAVQAAPLPGQVAEALRTATPSAQAEEVRDETRYLSHRSEAQRLPPPSLIPDYHTVKKTQTLWFLADIYLGDGERWPEIWALNPQINNPDLILPGMKVKMPKATAEQGLVPQQNAPQQNEQGEETVPATQNNDVQGARQLPMGDMSEEQLALAGLGLLSMHPPMSEKQSSRNRKYEASQHNPDGVFFFNELGGELQPYYRARCMDNGNSDTAYQAEQLDGLELAIGEDYASAELQTSPDSKGLVVDWEASVASRPVRH